MYVSRNTLRLLAFSSNVRPVRSVIRIVDAIVGIALNSAKIGGLGRDYKRMPDSNAGYMWSCESNGRFARGLGLLKTRHTICLGRVQGL